jgi:putative hydrolase of the HAD superfamily
MALVDRYPGVIFDYGAVLAFHQSTEDARRLAEIAQVPFEVFSQGYWSDRSPYDKGLVTAEDYWNDIAQKSGTTFTADQLRKLIEVDLDSWVNFDRKMYEFAESLRANGQRIAVLSNMPHELGEFIKKCTKGFAPFHHVTLSYEVRAIKPEPEIYHHCLEGLNLRPEETLFLDDRPENVAGAQKLGIHAVQFTSRDEVLPRLLAN